MNSICSMNNTANNKPSGLILAVGGTDRIIDIWTGPLGEVSAQLSRCEQPLIV
jgi:hypothetical protein